MDLILLAMPVALLLAWVNGANDNIKGAATLVGSGLTSPRRAILLASAATAAGGLASLWLAHGLLRAFSGQGMVPDDLAGACFSTLHSTGQRHERDTRKRRTGAGPPLLRRGVEIQR